MNIYVGSIVSFCISAVVLRLLIRIEQMSDDQYRPKSKEEGSHGKKETHLSA